MSVSFTEGCYKSMGSDMFISYSLQRKGWNAQQRSVPNRNYMMFSYLSSISNINNRIATHSR